MATRCRPGETPEDARARQALTMRQWREENAEHHRAYMAGYREKNREHLSEYERQRANRRYKESPGFKQASLERIRRWQTKVGNAYLRKQANDRTRRLKIEIVEAYGGKCACCGDTHFEFMTIHHKDGKGAAHRKRIFGAANAAGTRFYRWLKARGFPKKNFELNCWNCNVAKDMYGFCPHEVIA